jgi:hypothetical protein
MRKACGRLSFRRWSAFRLSSIVMGFLPHAISGMNPLLGAAGKEGLRRRKSCHT